MAALAIPGSIITVSGLMLFFQNLTSHWATSVLRLDSHIGFGWSGHFHHGHLPGDEHRKQSGLKVMKVAAVLFIVFGVFFEMILSPSGLMAGRYTFPVLLILLGGYLVLSRSGLLGSHKSSDEPKSEFSS